MNIYPDFEEYNVKEPGRNLREYGKMHPFSSDSASNTGALGSLLGMQIIQTESIDEFIYRQFRFPKSKRKRIRNKFKKNSKNYRTQANVILMNGKMVMHPNTFSTIKKQMLDDAVHKAHQNSESTSKILNLYKEEAQKIQKAQQIKEEQQAQALFIAKNALFDELGTAEHPGSLESKLRSISNQIAQQQIRSKSTGYCLSPYMPLPYVHTETKVVPNEN